VQSLRQRIRSHCGLPHAFFVSPKSARPDRGMPGRVYQIDAWVDGGRSTDQIYATCFVICQAGGDIGPDGCWSQGPACGFKVFRKTLTHGGAWRIFLQNSKQLAREKIFYDSRWLRQKR
jgi:hypothetical protein